MPGPTFWGLCIVSGIVFCFCASRGGSRSGGVFGPLGTAVPWGVLLKRAGRPMGPATLL